MFGTTEEDNGGGLREWHNGAGEIYKPYNYWWLVVFLDVGFWSYLNWVPMEITYSKIQAGWHTTGTPGIAKTLERN